MGANIYSHLALLQTTAGDFYWVSKTLYDLANTSCFSEIWRLLINSERAMESIHTREHTDTMEQTNFHKTRVHGETNEDVLQEGPDKVSMRLEGEEGKMASTSLPSDLHSYLQMETLRLSSFCALHKARHTNLDKKNNNQKRRDQEPVLAISAMVANTWRD